MENYRLQPNDGMKIRITNAFIKRNVYRDGRLIARWRNFSGAPTHFNSRGGDRRFTIDLNLRGNAESPFMIEFGNNRVGWRPVTIEDLVEMGWKIDIYDVRIAKPDVVLQNPDEYIPNANIEVVVKEHEEKYKDRDPKVFQHMDGRDEPFMLVFHPNPMNQNELPIETLDEMWIDKAQICLNHSDMNKAYLDFMHVYPKNRDLRARNYGDWTR